MAFRYRQITPQVADIINPDDWNVNVREYTNEFNGHLDRDNLPEKGILTTSIKPQAFHQVHSALGQEDKLFSKKQSRFKAFQILEFETQHQGIVMCEWSGSWTFDSIVEALDTDSVQEIDYRLLVNGAEVSRIRRDNNLKKKSSGYMVGALPVEAGMVRVQVEFMTSQSAKVEQLITMLIASGRVTLHHRELIVVLRVA